MPAPRLNSPLIKLLYRLIYYYANRGAPDVSPIKMLCTCH